MPLRLTIQKPLHVFASISLLAALSAQPAQASEPIQNLKTLAQGANTFLSENLQKRLPDATIGIKVRPINPALRLSTCPTNINYQTTSSRLSRTMRVKISCDSLRTSWSTIATADVTALAPVLIAKETLSRGDKLDSSNVSRGKTDIMRLSGDYFADFQGFKAYEVTRRIKQGDILMAKQLKAFDVVERDSQLTVYVKRNGVTVSYTGTALSSGAVGDRIRVKNNSNGRNVYALVTGRGTALQEN